MSRIEWHGSEKSELIDRLTAVIRRHGRITFADFMRVALYEPELGYYMTSSVRSGRGGDYFTSPELHPIFGELVGQQVLEMARLLVSIEFRGSDALRRGHGVATEPRSDSANIGMAGNAQRTLPSGALSADARAESTIGPPMPPPTKPHGSLDDAEPVTIVEMGAGRGVLAEDVLGVFERSWPEWPKRLRYVIVEVNPHMAERQHERLSRFLSIGADVQWGRSVRQITPGDGFTGIVFSNELVDAFPVHRVVIRGGQLRERYVTLDGEQFVEEEDAPSTPALTDYFTRTGIILPEGFATEVNLQAVDWMSEVGQALRSGFVLTIDYGHSAEERYAPPRRHGTLACYAGHQRTEDPYVRIGKQDITAHIDFSALVRAGRSVGLELTGFTDQTSFLLGLGGADAMEARLARQTGLHRETEVAAFKTLLAPDGMGRLIRVLIQHKGLVKPRLRGLSFRPFFMPASFQSDGPP